MKPAYYDTNATTQINEEVLDLMIHFFRDEFGNPGSRTHIYGQKAKEAIEKARDQVALIIGCKPDEIIFTSGATEANNIAILGLLNYGLQTNKRHIITTTIEHKAVLEPILHLESRGFAVDYLNVNKSGRVDPQELKNTLRNDTLLVSIMHVNNETGVQQDILACCEVLKDHSAYFHCDAAQSFGKVFDVLNHKRIDFISISGHKIFGPMGVGALITKRRRFKKPPLKPIFFGGGQERGLRSGTLATPLIAGFGLAAEISKRDFQKRLSIWQQKKQNLLVDLNEYQYKINGDPNYILPHVLNLSVEGWDSEAFMLANKDRWALSNGSACTSSSYEGSYVLKAMGLSDDIIANSIRMSF